MQNDPQDFITVLIAVLALITSKELAVLLGPYAGIAACSCAGAAISLSGNDKEMSNWQACMYVTLRVFIATVLTVGIAEFLQNIIPSIKPRYSLIPLAFGIGWIKDYDSVRAWVGNLIDGFTKKRADDGK